MRSAETIVKEYLDRGYSVECLRVLAESRPEPLCSEMLAILETVRGEADCPAEGKGAPAGSGDDIFFVADDDDSVSDVDAVDFDVMASPAPLDPEPETTAADEESVADILIGETDGSEVVGLSPLPGEDRHSSDIEEGKTRLLAAKAVLDPAPWSVEPAAVPDAAVPVLAAFLPSPPSGAAGGARTEAGERLGRKERRRRERAEKKRRQAHAAGAIDAAGAPEMPEIVLARAAAESVFREETPKPAASPVPETAIVSGGVHESAAGFVPEAGEHSMRAADADAELLRGAYRLLDDDTIPGSDAEDAAAESAAGDGVAGAADAGEDRVNDVDDNVIPFRLGPVFSDAGTDAAEAGAEPEEEAGPRLRMLSPADPAEELAGAGERADFAPILVPAGEKEISGETGLSPAIRLGLLRAVAGTPLSGGDGIEMTAPDSMETARADEYVVSVEPVAAAESEPEDPTAKLLELQAEMEREYQERLDEFARRLLESQSILARSEGRVAEARAESEARATVIKDLNAKAAEDEKRLAAVNETLTNVRAESDAKGTSIRELAGVREEHERLYAEFEDLRRGYNELVTDALPSLQNERDDLALTVERQCDEETRLRSSLSFVRRRLLVGYSLAAAACLMLVGLPAFNWFRSDAAARRLAVDHQQATELAQRLQDVELRNVAANKNLVDMQRKLDKGEKDMKTLRAQNVELTRVADKRAKELAGLKASGAPTRAVSMALSGPVAPDGGLRRNEVRDPGGEIDQVVARNHEMNQRREPASASRNGSARIPVSAVAVNAPAGTRAAAAGARPSAGEAVQNRREAAPPAARNQNEVLAEVKAGDGVAQVVYRTLGTSDPAVIDWVIRENNVKRDKRGNPIIHPNQKLRLPKDGRTGEAASAAGRR